MKAVILAAGIGSRLRPITNDIPKCMVPVNGIRIIDKQLNNLVSNGINDIYVITGYKSEVLSFYLQKHYPSVRIIENTLYLDTNNMYSLFLAKNYVFGQDFLLMNADVYFERSVISGLLTNLGVSKIACDRSKFLDESMKIKLKDDRVYHISKTIPQTDYYAVSIDVYYIAAADSRPLFDEIENTIIVRGDRNSWTEVALDHVLDKADFRPYVIDGKWFEIDNHDDLSFAEALFAGDSLCEI
ncbi:MAG: phosphocholine cytidylyltransferase family protein [Bacteroidales bacterium]|nr:phosphocholine cytidylyltransferase family protein [Bacteroidales bacterium]